jgi:hypothetical protein
MRQGRSYCSLCTLDTIHRLFFVTRLIINKMNKVQLVDFKLENVLVSLHSLTTMGLAPFGASAPLFLRNGELLGHSPIHNKHELWQRIKVPDDLFFKGITQAYIEKIYIEVIDSYVKKSVKSEIVYS